MAKNYVADGNVVDHVAGSAISSGDVVPLGDCAGVALVDIANTEIGAVAITGVFTVAKVTGVAWAQGDSLDWDASNTAFGKDVTPAAGDIENCAVAYADAGSAAAEGQVKLTPGTGTAQ